MAVPDLRWFKTTFGETILRHTVALPFGLDLITAIAM